LLHRIFIFGALYSGIIRIGVWRDQPRCDCRSNGFR
jgi:hypothetical protein